jgi:four helix bundle protein
MFDVAKFGNTPDSSSRRRGHSFARPRCMAGARRFTELAAWQRVHELQLLCEELLKNPRVQRDFKFRDQLSDAASSGPRNIAEGFGRFRPRENAQYVRVAKGSANEVLTLFMEAQTKGYIGSEEFPRFETAANRAIGTVVRYVKYLETCDPDGPTKPPPKRRKSMRRSEPRNPGT